MHEADDALASVPRGSHIRSSSSRQIHREHQFTRSTSSAVHDFDEEEKNAGYDTVVERSNVQATETSLLLAGAKSMYGSYNAQPESADTLAASKEAPITTRAESRRPPYYQGHRRMLSFAETVHPITLTWSNVNVYAPVKATGLCGRTYKTGEVRQLLVDVSGMAKPGNLLAVMGASGSGKSVLLSVLTCRSLGDIRMEGDVRMNGQHVSKSITALSAYIQQEDVFVGTMKVHEHLWFHAQLRMDSHIPMKDRATRIQEVMTEMGLQKCANTPIGIPGSVKGISGGEMKRLSFASEVLTNPPLLICDEPTSGLDAFMAENVIGTLRAMAAKGKTIIVTIHQPSSEVFNMFDDLMLLAEGRLAYFGPVKQALDFFRSSGYPCPLNFNPADHYMHCLAIHPDQEPQCRQRMIEFATRYKDTEEYRNLRIGIRYMEENRDFDLLQKTEMHELQERSPYKASWCRQLIALTGRCWLSQVRDFNVSAIRVLQTVIVAVLIGLVFFNQTLNEKGIININGAMFLFLTNMTFSNSFTVFNSFPLELRVFHREHNNGMYRTDAYFLAKNIAELFIFLLLPTLFAVIDYWMVGLRPGIVHFCILWLTIMLVTLTAVSFGYFLSTTLGRVDLCLSYSPPILQGAMFFAGYLLNLSTIPVWLSWLQYLSWFRYGYEMLMTNQWAGYQNLTCSANSTFSTRGSPCFRDGDSVLMYYGLQKDRFWIDVGGLMALIVVLRLGSFIALWIRAKN